MELWEAKAANLINRTRTLVRHEMHRLYQEHPPTEGRDFREHELELVLELLVEVKAHIDTHGQVMWEYQAPLPH